METFLERCHRHGLTVPLHNIVENFGHPDSNFRAALKQAYKAEFFHYARYRSLLERLHEGLARRKVRVLLLKGAGMWFSLYADPLHRHVSDLDLGVRQEDRISVLEILAELNFPIDEEKQGFMDPAGCLVDLHCHSLGAIEENCGLGLSSIFERARQVKQFPFLLIADPADEVAYLAIHALKHSYLRLLWLLDFQACKRRGEISPTDRGPAAKAIQVAEFMLAFVQGQSDPDTLNILERRLCSQMLSHDVHPLGLVMLALYQRSFRMKVRFLRRALRQNEEPGNEWKRILGLLKRGLTTCVELLISRGA